MLKQSVEWHQSKIDLFLGVIRVLIDNAETIGQVPSDIAQQAATIEATRAKLEGRKGRHKRRDSVSHLLRGTINKLTGRLKDGIAYNTIIIIISIIIVSNSPSLDFQRIVSPDLQPTCSKRLALEDSDDPLFDCLSGNSNMMKQRKGTVWNSAQPGL